MKQSTQPFLHTSQADGQAILGQVRPALGQGALGCLRDPSWVWLLSLNQPPTVPEVHQLAGLNNAMRLTSEKRSLQSP
jgi:hypothetical protein